jgi:glutathione S-transferase
MKTGSTVKLKLYYMPGTIALASHITLAESGAEYEIEKVDFTATKQRSPEYLKINPKGRVPALVTAQGILTETPAILTYIAQAYPSASLAPIDRLFEFARCQEFNSYFCSTVHVAHSHRMRGHRWADDENAIAAMQHKVPQTMSEGMALIEQALAAGPWLMGRQYTICDPYLFTMTGWLEGDGVALAQFPRLQDHHHRMSERPAVRRAQWEQARGIQARVPRDNSHGG